MINIVLVKALKSIGGIYLTLTIIHGETVETESDLIFLGSKITADGDCSHEIKTLTHWKESYDQLR